MTAQQTFPVLAKECKARVDKGDANLAKAKDFYDSAAHILREVQSRMVSGEKYKGGFTGWLKTAGIGRTKAYEVLAIADGKKTLAEVREGGKKRQEKHRKANKEAREAATPKPDRKKSQQEKLADQVYDIMQSLDINECKEILELARDLAGLN